jgi:hypothetical protein
MKTMLMAAALAGALYVAGARAGEDSTDRYGHAGTGVPYYATNCGLHRFPGPRGNREDRRPCGRAGLAYNENGELITNPGATDKKAPAASGADKAQK